MNALAPLITLSVDLGTINVDLVVKKRDSVLWNAYIERHHYLGHQPLPGAQLRYLVRAAGEIVAVLGFGASAWKTKPRDEAISWSSEQRQRHLHLVVNSGSSSGPCAIGTPIMRLQDQSRGDLGLGAIAGHQVEMSPRLLAAGGLLYAGRTGTTANVVVDYIGGRWLNAGNSVFVGGYTTVDASLAHRIGRYTIHVDGCNLTDRRDPVAPSELQESVTVTATAGYYRLPGRSVVTGVSASI